MRSLTIQLPDRASACLLKECDGEVEIHFATAIGQIQMWISDDSLAHIVAEGARILAWRVKRGEQ